jgi:hypothetical protein
VAAWRSEIDRDLDRAPLGHPSDQPLEDIPMTPMFRRTVVTTAAFLLIGLAAVGLVEAGVAIGSTGQAPAPIGGSGAAGDPALAADIDALLAADQTSGPTAAPPSKARINAAVGGLRRLAAARRLVHATVVVDLPNRGLTTVQLDHGTITAVTATSLTVKEAGDTTASVTLGDETRVRKNAAKAAIADLKIGDEVFVMSKVETDGTVAYLVVVPGS